MPRKRTSFDCPDCNQRPNGDRQGRLVCACGREYFNFNKRGIAGSPEEQELLRQNRWELKKDEKSDDSCWLGPDDVFPVRAKLYLYQDGTWESVAHEKAEILEDYLTWYSDQVRIIRPNYFSAKNHQS
jgi:hypothetical protein